jgi:hypothetical protein
LIAYWASGASSAAVSLAAYLFLFLGMLLVIALTPKSWFYRPTPTPFPDFDAIARQVFMDDEFRPYAPERDAILKRFKDEHGSLDLRAADLRQEAQALTNGSSGVIRDGSRLKHRLLSIRLPCISLTAFVLASAITGSVGKVVANRAGFAFTPFQRIIVSVVAAVALVVQTVQLSLSYSRAEGQANSVVSDEVLAWNLFSRSLRAAVDEALRRSINDIFDVRGMLAVATAAPRLVELDASDIRPSRSLAYVRNFIKTHDSSAIGLAGVRGAGKSTIMRALIGDKVLAQDWLLVSAPVVYDATAFARSLLTKVAEKIVGQPRPEPRLEPNRIARSRYGTFAIAVAIAGALIASDLVPVKYPTFGPSSIVGFTILAYAIAGMYYSVFVGFLYRRLRSEISPLQKKASEILEVLQWEVERGSVAKNVGKLAIFGELHDEDSIKRKRRTMDRLDSVSYLRELLQDYASQKHRPIFLICIDELDKLPSSVSLVDVINNLKDMFHVQHVHLVVSVSIDALRLFEQRGVPNRDAFDSSFDNMVNVSNLTLDESVDILLSRAAGFPSRLAGYCHAWSGGLPRDLLRVARRCVEIQQDEARAISVADLIVRLIREELLRLADGLLGTTGNSDADTLLWTMREGLASGLQQDDILSHISRIRVSLPTEHGVVNAAITRYCIGLYIIYVAQFIRSDGSSPEQPSNEVIDCWFSLLAQASASTSLDVRLQQLALDECVRRIPLDQCA